MLLSFALIILLGFSLKGIFEKLHLPGLLGMLAAGILLGPHVLNLVAPEILDISADLREIALIIILLRVGLSLDLKDLKRVGRPALPWMTFSILSCLRHLWAWPPAENSKHTQSPESRCQLLQD